MTPPAPDLIQAVLGFRAWSVDDDGGLRPIALGAVAGPWRAGPNQAVCHAAGWQAGGGRRRAGAGARHGAPDVACMCGLYALTDADDPRLPRHVPGLALGAIAAWGDLEVHRDGFRAEWATVVALAAPDTRSPRARAPHERAAARYGVELVTPELLGVTGLRFAAPIPATLLPGAPGLPQARAAPAPRRRARGRPARVAGASAPVAPAGRGLRVDDHVWLDASTLRTGITSAFAARLGAGPVDLALPVAGTHHRTSDALARITGTAGEALTAWTPLTAVVDRVNPALDDDPGLLLRDPEGEGWIATLAPRAWAAEAGGLEWGPRGTRLYREVLAGHDPWSDLRSTTVRVRSAGDVITALRARRTSARFADASDVRRRLIEPLRAALGADPRRGATLARLRARVTFELSEPASTFVLDATRAPAAVVPAGDDEARGPTAAGGGDDLTLRMSAAAAEQFLAGRLDVARALRAGELTSSAALGQTLAAVSVLTALPVVPAAPGALPPIVS